MLEEGDVLTSVARAPSEEVPMWEHNRTVRALGPVHDLEKLGGHGRDSTDCAIRLAAENEEAVSIIFVFFLILGLLATTSVWVDERGATAVKNAHDVSALLGSQCAQ